MKILMMALTMAVGFTVFADSQNDKLISFSTSGTSYYADGLTKVVDKECYALVWTKDGSTFAGFNADGSLKDETNNGLVRVVNVAIDGHCPPVTFVIPAAEVEGRYAGGDFLVCLLDTRDASGTPAVPSENQVGRVNWWVKCEGPGTEVNAAEDVEKVFGSYVCTYADGKVVFEGERCALVSCDKGGTFRGISWDGEPADAIVATFFAGPDGKFDIDFGGELAEDKSYELIVLDTRLPDGSALAASSSEELKFVRGFGELMLSDDGKAVSGIKWNAVKMGLSATKPVLWANDKTTWFAFDPTLCLEQGYAAVSPEEGKWEVYKLPEAWVAPIPAPELSKGAGTYWHLGTNEVPDPFTLESAYKFSAFDTALEDTALKYLKGEALDEEGMKQVEAWYQQVSPFWKWNCDFEVSFDRGIKADSVILAGFYHYVSAWSGKYTFDWVKEDNEPWVGSSPASAWNVGDKPIRLLKGYTGKSGEAVTMTYEEICTKVVQFLCGVKNLSSENYGTTMTVKLCMYENTGRCHESGNRIVIGTYNYTFCGPLQVSFNAGVDHPASGVEMPADINTNYNGKTGFPLPPPKFRSEDFKTLAFVGWSNRTDNVIMTYLPTNTWTKAGEPIELWSAWKVAQTTMVAPTGGTEKTSIKVTQEWIDENVPAGKTLDTVLNETKESEGGKIPVWQTYVLGLDPTGNVNVVSTEKLDDEKTLVISTVQAPPPDSGFKVTYSLDKIDKTSEKPIDDAHRGEEQESRDIVIELEPKGDEAATGYYKMNVFITPEEGGVAKDEEKVQVKSEVTVGVLTVKTEEPVVPVAIPWTSLADKADENAEIPADEIVQPQGLSEGDELFVYDRNGQVYTTLTLKDGKWVADGQTIPVGDTGTAGEATQPGEVPTVRRGYGMWLKRQDPSKSFHLFGQYNKTAEKTKVVPPADGQDKAEYNLIAPTGIEDTDLNSIPSLGTDVNPQDKLMIVEKGVPTYYNFNSDTKKWGYNKQEIVTRTVGGRTITGVRTKRVEEAVTVPAGTGLWYISKGGEPEIDWNAKQGE